MPDSLPSVLAVLIFTHAAFFALGRLTGFSAAYRYRHRYDPYARPFGEIPLHPPVNSSEAQHGRS